MSAASAPSSVVISFLHSDGSPIQLIDLGMEFLHENEIPMAIWERPFRVEVDARTSKAGNIFYEYQQNGVPLPDGLATRVFIEDAELRMGPERPSQRKHPTCEGSAELLLAGTPYVAKAYLTKGKSPCWVKVIAHRRPEPSSKPRGGRIL